jgi:hypothetical protein
MSTNTPVLYGESKGVLPLLKNHSFLPLEGKGTKGIG